MNDLISVVVPIYGVEKFLKLCVDSILGQTYKNLEIFLVDDESPDQCPGWCDEYAKQDERVITLHKKNGGLSDARNAVMDRLHGNYIVFVDSDDFLDISYIENLYRMIIKTKSDIAVCSWNEIDENNIYLPEFAEFDEHQTQVWGKIRALRALLYQVPIDNSVWSKMYRRELFEGIYFPKGKLYEDFATMYKVFSRADKVCYNPYPGYQYMLRGTGIMLQNFTVKKMDLIDFADEMRTVLMKQYPELENAIWSRFFRANCHIYLQIPSEKKYKKYRKRVEKNIRMSRGKVLRDRCSRRGTKLAALYTYLGFGMFRAGRRWKRMGKK